MWRLAFSTLLVGVAGVGLAYANSRDSPTPDFITSPVERGTVATLVKATGSVDAKITVDVSSQLSGRMAEVFVNFNDMVNAGQPLAQLDQESFLIAVKEAKAALEVATATAHVQQAAVGRAKLAIVNAHNDETLAEALVASAQAKQDEAQREFERKAQLAKTRAVAERDLSQARALRDTGAADLRAAIEQVKIKTEAIEIAEADLRMAEANLENAQAVIEQKQATVDQAELDLKRTVVRSPIDGVIVRRDVNPGQTIAVSLEAMTLFKIANNLDSMEVHGKIDETDIGKLKAGQSARFTVDAYPDRTFTGKVLQIRKASEVVQNVVTYTAVISAPNPELLLLPGMTAELRILVSDTGDVLKIPNQALRFRPEATNIAPERQLEQQASSAGTLSTVWIIGTDGRPAPVTVHVGQSDDSGTQLLDGPLTQGQPLVVGVGNSQVPGGFLGLRLGFLG
jgi:HlyD family secretion protein